ncbi:MAG TPA: MFS transporter [Acidimicrobiales bacterium]|nr:MFS transporter [Acidimicrobiales bacterium]
MTKRNGKTGSLLDRLLASESADDRRYLVFLIVIATAGWALASYDFNLLVTALPTIKSSLHLSPTEVGLLAFLVYVAMLLISLLVGYGMDRFGRKPMWQLALVGAAVFTGLTYFVHAFWTLVLVRALASGLANSELAISITLVNEQVPAKRRGLLYSIVQGGWPLGVLLASAVFLGFNDGLNINWHVIFLFGVIPLLMVIVGRHWVRPSERYEQIQELRAAKKKGDKGQLDELLERYDVDVDEIDKVSIRQLFAEPGWPRAQLIRTSIVWVLYAAGFVATNTYIVDWLTSYRHFSKSNALALLLVASGIGIAFYVLGGALGERFGRQRVLVTSALCLLGLTIGFYFVRTTWVIWLLYILLYQASNGTWSGTGYAYWAESFPTRVRGTAIGWLGAMFAAGLILGSGVWTSLVASEGAVTLLIVGAGFAVLQVATSFLLPHIPPGKELEEIAT